ncbi:unnamed protein product [Gongylonema pulchrum]|uniref:Uncharacterized protein n=1 Tax=Gongylonema pulchrum TaxID=637853 RepID=A0A183E606_9BILA|nr:unnamed protein product [Gongylonema pulchrum]
MDNGRARATLLDSQLAELKKVLEQDCEHDRDASTETAEGKGAARQLIKLPKIELIEFAGKAERAVAGYALTAENYAVVVDVLERRFDNIEWIRQELFNELMQLNLQMGKI